jgi:D-aminopeptidase
MTAGEENSMTDVPGVSVGHVTLIQGSGTLTPGRGPIRTGVTVILPREGNLYEEKLRAGVHVQNGAGELTGALQVMEWGILETPIALTNTLNVGLVHDAIVEYMLEQNPDIGDRSDVVLPVVGECDDSYLNDIRGRHVRREHVFEAFRVAGRKVIEGSVGAGTGMSALGFKAGVGTASRKTPSSLGGYVLGVLVVANFGNSPDCDLVVDGVPVGRELRSEGSRPRKDGSIITVIVTNAPLNSSQLTRISARVPLALGKVGSISSNSSGDISIAFSTAGRITVSDTSLSASMQGVNARVLDELFRATIEASEEAILDSIFVSDTMKGRDDNVSRGLPIDEVLRIMRKYGRL